TSRRVNGYNGERQFLRAPPQKCRCDKDVVSSLALFFYEVNAMQGSPDSGEENGKVWISNQLTTTGRERRPVRVVFGDQSVS
ncbi:hypothetical protein CSUI_011041, partial [Cystoisospora suis]